MAKIPLRMNRYLLKKTAQESYIEIARLLMKQDPTLATFYVNAAQGLQKEIDKLVISEI